METILVLTDFSANASRAAAYGYKLAEKLRADILLCHSDKDHTEPHAAEKLSDLATKLSATNCGTGNFIPIIKKSNVDNTLQKTVDTLTRGSYVPLIIKGLSGAGHQTGNLEGKDSRGLLDSVHAPLLLVPAFAKEQLPRKIAFATDLGENDVLILLSLATFARDLKAEITLIHIDNEESGNQLSGKERLRKFLDKASETIRFTGFTYQHMVDDSVENGLSKIAKDNSVDMLAMSHNRRRQVEAFLKAGESHTRDMIADRSVPLLVFPKDMVPSVYPVF